MWFRISGNPAKTIDALYACWYSMIFPHLECTRSRMHAERHNLEFCRYTIWTAKPWTAGPKAGVLGILRRWGVWTGTCMLGPAGMITAWVKSHFRMAGNSLANIRNPETTANINVFQLAVAQNTATYSSFEYRLKKNHRYLRRFHQHSRRKHRYWRVFCYIFAQSRQAYATYKNAVKNTFSAQQNGKSNPPKRP